MQRRWTIDELEERARLALSVDYEGPANGQVRAVPDARTIRYYASLGLVDRPAAMRGRTALYERRHLEQVVAIKRLQAHGMSLAEIQAQLAGASRKRIAQVAALPDEAAGDSVEPVPEAAEPEAAPSAARPAFWKAVPEQASEAQTPPPVRATGGASIVLMARVELAPGLELSFQPNRALDAADVARLRAAAEPLIAELARTGAIRT